MDASRKKMLCLEQTNDASIPLSICGTFLDELHSKIVDYFPHKYDDKNRLVYSAHGHHSLLQSPQRIEVLHSAPDFSHDELISVIVSIYDGRFPQPYEFFRCHENTSLHELKLFLTRAVNHPLIFIILGVNLLPIKLQEVILHSKFRFRNDCRDYLYCNLFCCRWYFGSTWTFTHPVIMKSNHVFTIWKHFHLFYMKCHGFSKKNIKYAKHTV